MSRNIDEMSTAEIQSYLKSRNTPCVPEPVNFYISYDVWKTYLDMLKDKEKLVPVPPSLPSNTPQKYVFNPITAIEEKLHLHFQNGKPSMVTFFGNTIGTFAMTSKNQNDVLFSIEINQYAEFWKLLETYPDLYVEVQTTTTHVGQHHHVRLYATTMVGKFDWFY